MQLRKSRQLRSWCKAVAFFTILALTLIPFQNALAIGFLSADWNARPDLDEADEIFASFVQGAASNTQTSITFTFAGGTTDFVSGTRVFELIGLSVEDTETINGTWTSLSTINILSGSLNIEVGVGSFPPVPNMFNEMFTNTSEPTGSETIDGDSITSGQSVFVTFTYSGLQVSGTSFTLTLNN
ncbi:MAG: hypothetical protein JNM56_06485 [Planctomycetia bacterium]|nr:hypothetical protein [Planctomycetia bacterium]